MRRKELEPYKNKKVIVQGIVVVVEHINQFDIHKSWKRNVKVLLKSVSVSGIQVDHLWLQEHEKDYEYCLSLVDEAVKFRAKVIPYIKRRHGVYIENYGIERLSRLTTKENYEKARSNEMPTPEEDEWPFDDNPFESIMEEEDDQLAGK